ncbi:MAG: serine/threonine protein kinase [bacterium]|nr:serine/threonine protein kinase [bacterium]
MRDKMDTILLLEADANHAEIIGQHFKTRNFDVLTSPSPAGFKEIAERQSADYLVIDLNAVGPDALAFHNWIQETRSLAGLPRVFIADKPRQELVLNLERDFSETVLYKPLNIDQVASILRSRPSQISTRLIPDRNTCLASLKGQKIGSAIISEEIGRGGMGAVFLGFQESLNRQVAVKVLLPGMMDDPHATERFKREAQATARLKSPHIVQIHDFGEWDNHIFYIMMEYLQGETLERSLAHNGRLTPARAVSIVMQTARGLLAAHDAGLVHRDIKPSNLILNSKGDITITDFGLVREQSKIKNTQTGMLAGTPHYLCPEQVSGVPLDSRSDIYSLGIVFYEMLVGVPPFLSNSAVEIFMKHLNTPLPDPRKVVPDIPSEVVDIIRRMAAKEPGDRFSDCRELFKAVEEVNGKYGFSDKIRSDPNRVPLPQSSKESLSMITAYNQTEGLESELPSFITPDGLKAKLVLTASGNILAREGEMPDNWKEALYVLHESAGQLNAAAQMGPYHFNIITTREEVLTLSHQEAEGTAKPNLKAMLFKQGRQTFSSLTFKRPTVNLPTGQSAPAPTQSIGSVAGVRDVLLFDMDAHVMDHAFNNPDNLDRYRMHFAPVTRIVHSIPLPIIDIDIRFQKGRVLIWKLENGVLFITADADINKSFLSIYVTSHMELLNNAVRTQTLPLPVTLHNVKRVVGEAVSSKLLADIQLALARWLGPIAKILLNKEIKKMGWTSDAFPRKELKHLVAHLKEKVDASSRDQFVEAVRDLEYEYRQRRVEE